MDGGAREKGRVDVSFALIEEGRNEPIGVWIDGWMDEWERKSKA